MKTSRYVIGAQLLAAVVAAAALGLMTDAASAARYLPRGHASEYRASQHASPGKSVRIARKRPPALSKPGPAALPAGLMAIRTTCGHSQDFRACRRRDIEAGGLSARPCIFAARSLAGRPLKSTCATRSTRPKRKHAIDASLLRCSAAPAVDRRHHPSRQKGPYGRRRPRRQRGRCRGGTNGAATAGFLGVDMGAGRGARRPKPARAAHRLPAVSMAAVSTCIPRWRSQS